MSKAAKRRSPLFVTTTWVSSFLSVGLLLFIGNVVKADLGSMRPCSTNSSGLSVSSCGKQSINLGDLILIGLFFLAACLVVALFTAAWRMTRRAAR